MEILVNQEPLSYSLETETELGQVIDGLARWLRGQQFAITAIDVDDQTVPIHDRSHWANRDVDTVSRLSVEAFPVAQVEQITLSAVGDYLVLLGRALDEPEPAALRDLAEELPYVRERIREFFPALAAGGTDTLLTDASLNTGALPEGDALAAVRTQLASVTMLVESRLREYGNPVAELALTLGQLVKSAEPLTRVPIQLQTGEDGEAMATVILFAELLSRVLRILPLVGDDDGLDVSRIGQFTAQLTPCLTQLQEAFEIQDSVLIGDLLEYEVAPRLAELPALIPQPGAGPQEPEEA